MNIDKKFIKAATLASESNKLAKELSELFKATFYEECSDCEMDIFLQTDGWCFLWGERYDQNNTPLSSLPTLSKLIKLDKDEFFKLLEENSI